jgi:hypothetical protein
MASPVHSEYTGCLVKEKYVFSSSLPIHPPTIQSLLIHVSFARKNLISEVLVLVLSPF